MLSVNQYILAFNYQHPEQVAQLEAELDVSLDITESGTSLKIFSLVEREAVIAYFWKLATPYLEQQFKDVFIERFTEYHQRPPHPTLIEAYYQEYTQADLPETVKFATMSLTHHERTT